MKELLYMAWHKKDKKLCRVTNINFEKGAFLDGLLPGEGQYFPESGMYVPPVLSGRFSSFEAIDLFEFVGLRDDADNLIFANSTIFTFEYLEKLNKVITLTGNFIWDEEELGYSIIIYNDRQYVCLRYIGNGQFRNFKVIGNLQENPELIGEK